MRRNNEQAESMKHRFTSEGNRARRGVKPVRWRGLVSNHRLYFALIGAALFAVLTVSGQSPLPSPSPTPLPPCATVVTVNVSKTEHTQQCQFPGDQRPSSAKIEFVGNGQELSFVVLDELPKGVSLKTDGPLNGYQEGQPIRAGEWYWFRRKLPLIMEIAPEAKFSFPISYWFGEVTGSEKQHAESTAPDDMRKFVDSHLSSFQKRSDKLTLGFTWGNAGPLATPTASATPSPSPSPSTSPAVSLLSYGVGAVDYLFDNPIVGIVVGVVAFFVLIILWLYVLPALWEKVRQQIRVWGMRRDKRRQGGKKEQGSQPKPGSELDDLYPAHGVQRDRQTEKGRESEGVSKSTAWSQRTSEGGQHRPGAGDVAYPTPKAVGPSESSMRQDGMVAKLEGQIEALKTLVEQKVNRDENLTQAAELGVTKMLLQRENGILLEMDARLRKLLTQEVKPVEDLLNEKAASLNASLEKTDGQIAQMSAEQKNVREKLDEVLTELRHAGDRLNLRISEFEQKLDSQTERDSFYAKTLGAVLGQNVEALQEGNFERLIGERLNQFFQTGVDRGDGLPDLRARLDGINAAVREVASHIEKLSIEAYDETRPHLQEVEKLVTDLSGMQSQLQDRRTVLHIPVSLHAGARQTFLDGLGRGVKREIEKLENPEGYFESELERLITADLIAIVDICDKRAAKPPGSRPELELALKQLFDLADLRSILPRPGEPFKVAEQDLIQMTDGGSSLTVAHVQTRGFYYKHRDRETLLRKAGVMVYR